MVQQYNYQFIIHNKLLSIYRIISFKEIENYLLKDMVI